jgi:hypothetical protein
VPNWGARMSQGETFYEGRSFYEGPTWSFIREQIGEALRERYQVPKELTPTLLALVRNLEAIESKLPRARTLIGTLDAIEGNYLRRYAPPVAPRSGGPSDDWLLCT